MTIGEVVDRLKEIEAKDDLSNDDLAEMYYVLPYLMEYIEALEAVVMAAENGREWNFNAPNISPWSIDIKKALDHLADMRGDNDESEV